MVVPEVVKITEVIPQKRKLWFRFSTTRGAHLNVSPIGNTVVADRVGALVSHISTTSAPQICTLDWLKLS
jgi:hypothetical protein